MTERDRIRPYERKPSYWQYKGEPVLLIGGSVEDNLFQIPNLQAHLDLLQSVGGNYVRCTMSSRDEGDVWPFALDPKTGLYDLNIPNKEYWARFERFLKLASERDIIAQFEMWDRFDFARDPWQRNPYNPKCNTNYTAQESGLLVDIHTHPGERENAFFRSVPALDNNETVLRFQQAQVDSMLSISLRYGNVLYCMDNETNESPEWPAYWARYIRAKAARQGVGVETTEMWNAHDVLDPIHDATYDHPEIYSFIDISQNNHSPANSHWTNPQTLKQRLAAKGRVCPINSVKIYGANSGRYGSTRDAQERFWRNILGGLASSRFHRPPAGIGLSGIAQAHIRSMRMLSQHADLFRCEPHNDLLQNRSWNEAYCAAVPGEIYIVFFTDGGDVLLDVSATAGHGLSVRWLDIRRSEWTPDQQSVAVSPDAESLLRLVTPREEGYWCALVTP